MLNCEVGDIVLVSKYKYTDGTEGAYHNFVIMEIMDDELALVPLEYFGFVISSKTEKNNDTNPNFPYNQPISADEINRLQVESHVKCDEWLSIKPDNVIMKWGNVTVAQFAKFRELYQKSIEEKINK